MAGLKCRRFRGGDSKSQLGPADDHAGDVVVLGGGADELIEGAHDVGEGQGGAFLTRELDHGEEAGFAEFVAALVPSFGDAVGVNYEEVMGFDAGDPRFVVFI
jgi:hypothetical protein